MSITALSINYVCPFKSRLREYKKEQHPTTRLHWEKLKRKYKLQ